MRLVACAHCHTQYDVSGLSTHALRCHCGVLILVGPQEGRMVAIARCGQCGAPWTEGAERCGYCGGVLDPTADLPLICPECQAHNPEGSKHCRGCGVAFRPEPVGEEKSDQLCPRCNGNGRPTWMYRRELRGLRLDECPACHGLWVGRDDFDRLVARTAEAHPGLPNAAAWSEKPDPHASFRYSRCPACDQLMQRRNFEKVSGVIIDRCAAHGVWLDAEELERIAQFIADGGLEKAREQAQTLALENARRLQEHSEDVKAEVESHWMGSILAWIRPF